MDSEAQRAGLGSGGVREGREKALGTENPISTVKSKQSKLSLIRQCEESLLHLLTHFSVHRFLSTHRSKCIEAGETALRGECLESKLDVLILDARNPHNSPVWFTYILMHIRVC